MTDDNKLPLTSADMTEALLAQLRAAPCKKALAVFLDKLGYRYWDESDNAAYRLFLG